MAVFLKAKEFFKEGLRFLHKKFFANTKQLPSLKARDVIRILKRLGFREDGQKGSHLLLVHSENGRRTVVPVHGGKDIKKPLLKKIIEEDAGLTIEEFLSV